MDFLSSNTFMEAAAPPPLMRSKSVPTPCSAPDDLSSTAASEGLASEDGYGDFEPWPDTESEDEGWSSKRSLSEQSCATSPAALPAPADGSISVSIDHGRPYTQPQPVNMDPNWNVHPVPSMPPGHLQNFMPLATWPSPPLFYFCQQSFMLEEPSQPKAQRAEGAESQLEDVLSRWEGRQVQLGEREAAEVLQQCKSFLDKDNFGKRKWGYSVFFLERKWIDVSGHFYAKVASLLLQEAAREAPQDALVEFCRGIAEMCERTNFMSLFSGPSSHVLQVLAERACDEALELVYPFMDVDKMSETKQMYLIIQKLVERPLVSTVANQARQSLWEKLERLSRMGQLSGYLQQEFATFVVQSLTKNCSGDQVEFLFQNVIPLVKSPDTEEATNSSFVLEKLLKNRKAAEKAPGREPGALAVRVAQWFLHTEETDRVELVRGLRAVKADKKANRAKGSGWQANKKNPVDVLIGHIK